MEEKQKQEPLKAPYANPSSSTLNNAVKATVRNDERKDVAVSDVVKPAGKPFKENIENLNNTAASIKQQTKTPNDSLISEHAGNISVDAKPDDTLTLLTSMSTMSDVELAKLERKRRQQQQKEELLRKLKRPKPDENSSVTDPPQPTREDSSSPIPEGEFSAFILTKKW